MTGRRIDKPIEGLGNYLGQRLEDYPKEVMQGWKNLGLRLTGRSGEATPIGSLDAPIAESVGGLAITPLLAKQQVARGLYEMLATYGKGSVSKVQKQKTKDVIKVLGLLPESAHDPITKLSTWKKIKAQAGGAESPIGRKIPRPGGKSEIARTLDFPGEGIPHEYAHAFQGYIKHIGKNDPITKYSMFLDEVSTIGNKRAAQMGKSFYKGMPNEILAKNFEKNFTTATNMWTKPLSEKGFKDVYQQSMVDTLRRVKTEAPELYDRGVKAMRKKYTFSKRGIKRIPQTPHEKIDAIFGPLDTGKRFPQLVKGPTQATQLGKEFPVKELNRVMLKERKQSADLYKKAFAKDIFSEEGKVIEDLAGLSAQRSAGAREAMESLFVGSRGKEYTATTRFKPAEFDVWLNKELKK